jgi:hypothetical protein
MLWYPALTTMGYKNHSVRSDRYRYNVWSDGTEELYDHQNDPMEWNNLIKNTAYSEIVTAHRTWLPSVNVPNSPAVGSAPAISESPGFSVFPNPAYNTVVLKSATTTLYTYHYRIIDTNGKVLGADTVRFVETPIPIHSLSPGTYFIQLAGPAGAGEVLRFVKH